MIQLFASDIWENNRKSSKGNQLKWRHGDYWYKADYMGYEGLAECVVSSLLEKSSLDSSEYVCYEPETIEYKNTQMKGCRSKNFLKDGEQLVTLERLFFLKYGTSLYESIFRINNEQERLVFLTNQISQLTGLRGFGEYLCKLFTIDAFFLNEDRHMHNIAVIMKEDGSYRLCPAFDNGASLLSDTNLDYPLTEDLFSLMTDVHSKSISADFEKQLEAAEKLHGEQIHFSFTNHDIQALCNRMKKETEYDTTIIDRVGEILLQQRRKYAYLFQIPFAAPSEGL